MTRRARRLQRPAISTAGTARCSTTPKKQNPVSQRGTPRAPKGHTPCPKGAHTDDPKPGRKPSKYIPKGHIDSAASMYPKGAHNSLPLPKVSKPGKATPEHHCSPAPGSEPRYVLSSDPKAFKEYLGTFEPYAGYGSLPLELRLMALGLTSAKNF